MARQRRGGGGSFRPPELRGTLGTLLRTTLQQAGVVRDALERGAREGRSRLDDALAGRRRQDALAELGEIVLELVRRGEIDPDQLPEARDVIRHLDELDDESSEGGHHHHHHGDGDHDHHHDDGDDHRHPHAPARTARDADDGTVSSSRWSPPKRATPAAPRVWRPPVDDAPAAEAAPPARMPPHPHKKGGISFDEDDDLADYMHPDDVPAKKPGDGES